MIEKFSLRATRNLERKEIENHWNNKLEEIMVKFFDSTWSLDDHESYANTLKSRQIELDNFDKETEKLYRELTVWEKEDILLDSFEILKNLLESESNDKLDYAE